mgnify:CR=1 FL=1|tara:strand:+ start:341 stop:514 length:174 start_codon:yes stop_codon:yes gene_type:complete
MVKYRIIKKVILHDSLDYDQAKYAISNLEENDKEEMHIEEYEVKEPWRLGRDPDLKK